MLSWRRCWGCSTSATTWFPIAGLLHPRLRTALLPRQMLRLANHDIRIRVGKPVASANLAPIGNDEAVTRHLRMRTYLLRDLPAPSHEAPATVTAVRPPMQRVIDGSPAALLRAEFEALPGTQVLAESSPWRVVYACAGQIPWLLQEVGRLRELSFRAVGEGTGRGADIDLFDSCYIHLLLWNIETGEIAGAYRLGLADEIVRRFGPRGLYTHSLFRYGRRFLDAILPAIELGRSFVRPEYQRGFAPLMMLWRGIGEFVARHPRYRTLFGPVSISNDYHVLSRSLLVDYLRTCHYEPALARLVKPRRPFRAPLKPPWQAQDLRVLGDIEMPGEVVAEIERDQKGPPVLLRQYLRLGGQLLGFNVDAGFGNALDGLIMVDLCATDVRLLGRYMGVEGARRFLEFHHRPRHTRRRA